MWDFIRAHATPLTPVDPGYEPRVFPIPGIRAILFDIYGTLLISAAGDVSHDSQVADQAGMLAVCRYCREHMGVHLNLKDSSPGDPSEDMALWYRQILASHAAHRKTEGVEYPEIEIREVFTELLTRLEKRPWGRDEVEALVIVFESEVNAVWPMPGAVDLLERLKSSRLALGIVSNAQFYTPIVCEALFGRSWEGFGFHQDLTIYSYEHLRGKPSPQLFDLARTALEARGITPEQVLYVGNDMIKDILPASAQGFRTGLFAGDRRSLRLGGNSWQEVEASVDLVITDWIQLKSVL